MVRLVNHFEMSEKYHRQANDGSPERPGEVRRRPEIFAVGGFVLTEKQRQLLRNLLLSLGIALSPMSSGPKPVSETDSLSNFEDKSVEVSAEQTEQKRSRFIKELLVKKASISESDRETMFAYSQKPVAGRTEMTREEYVRENINFAWDEENKKGIPPAVQDVLKRILPGLVAQESRFIADRKNTSTGALGILQIMPDNWERIRGSADGWQSLENQVNVAGELMTEMYNYLISHLGGDLLNELREHLGTEELFARDLLVPLLVNSYNAGPARVAEAVRLYWQETPPAERPAGIDLFYAVSQFAEHTDKGQYLSAYKQESAEYFMRVIAQYLVLEDMKRNKNQG